MTLPDDATAPLLLRLAEGAVLYLHIGAGLTGIASGFAAMVARKGGRAHRLIGNVFFVSMLIMSAIGAAVSPLLPQRANVVPGLLVFYLTATAWAAARRPPATVGRFEIAALGFAWSAAALGVSYGLRAASAPDGLLDGDDALIYFAFASFTAFAGLLDVTVLLRGGLAGPARLSRHLWRMSVALFIAAGSLFLGQPKVFPPTLRGSPILFAPELAVLALLVFWLIRVRFKGGRPKPRAAAGPAFPTGGEAEAGA